MTFRSRRKHPIIPPSIPRSTRFNFLVLFAALTLPGCGIIQDLAPVSAGAGYPGDPPPSAFPQTSRFADIGLAKFFRKPATTPVVPLPPPPAPVELIPVAELQSTASDSEQAEAEITTCRPVKTGVQLVQNRVGRGYADENSTVARSPVNDPSKLKRITEIQPFHSYEPDPLVRAKDPCKNLCPRPDGAPCQNLPGQTPMMCPDEVVLSNAAYPPRQFGEKVMTWEASNIHYNPLYFQDVGLERYGHSYPFFVQPFASIAKFSVQLVGLPYQMAIDPVCKKMYPLGYYRPGECAPKLIYQIPWNTRAAITQAGVTTGLIYLFP